jgi:serine/threonine protein kinase
MDAELKSGSRLGRYELLTQLGRGGMASVWVAREWSPSRARQRLVAVKAMLPELARRPDFRSMFLEEGQIVRSIDHPNVVKVYEVAEDRGILYMAMEWVEGDSLRAVIKEAKRRRAIPPEMAVRIIADTAAGLHAAHELRGWDGELRNLVHCDISPHNILVGLDGQAKLVDFGVANATAHSELGSNDTIKGKFAYMSPEQAQAQKIDRRSDIFALGIVLFELTTGERLFRGENAAHTLKLVTSGKIPDPRDLHPKYPEKLATIVKKALSRDVNARYQTAEELREALERYLVEERILVAKASVGQLVRRVLGARIEQQRAALREALVAADGVVQEGLLPNSPAALRDAGWNQGDYSTPGADPRVPRPTFTLSDPPTSSQATTSAPFQQTLDTPAPKRRSALGGVLFAVFGVSAAAGAIIWAKNQGHPTELISTTLETKTEASNRRAAAQGSDDPGPSGVNVDELPAEERQAYAPSTGGRSRASAKKDDTSKDAKKSASEELPENPYAKGSKEPAQASTVQAKTPAPEPEVATPPPPPPPPPPQEGEAGPFSRGAALAALGSASSRASSCKRPDGPSGMGRATVTFAPNGTVSSVVVPAPFAGTSVGECVVAVFKGARVPAFTGSSVQLPQSFRIPD